MFKHLKGDVTGGISAAVIALPLALAFWCLRFCTHRDPRGPWTRGGGRTRISGMLHGVILLLNLVGLGSAAGWIPMCVLGAILMVTAVSMLDTYSLSQIGQGRGR